MVAGPQSGEREEGEEGVIWRSFQKNSIWGRALPGSFVLCIYFICPARSSGIISYHDDDGARRGHEGSGINVFSLLFSTFWVVFYLACIALRARYHFCASEISVLG